LAKVFSDGGFMKRLLALLCLVAAPAMAEELPYLEPIESRFGSLTIADVQVEYGDAQQVMLGGSPVAGLVDRFVSIRALLPRPDGTAADWVLVSMANGGNGCPMLWAFVEVTAAGAVATDPFGTCSEAVLNPRTTDDGQVALDMTSYIEGEDYATYTYNGSSVSELIVRYNNDGATAAGAGDDVSRWSGGHPAAPFEDAGERLRFETIMSADEVLSLAARVVVGSDTITQDGFVIGQGFDPASGGDIAAMWAIRIADGAPLAIFMDTGQAPLAFGMSVDEWPVAAIDFMGVP
jgi:hypothetical protein